MNTKFISATKLLNRNIKELPTLVEPILPKSGLCAVAGSSDTGKSSFLRQLAVELVLGSKSFLGFKLNPQHKRVIYVSTEDDERALAYLLNRSNTSNKRNSKEYEGLKFLFETENLIKTLETEITENQVDLVIIDAFSDLYPGNMNDSNQVRNYLNQFNQIAQKHECLVIFLHHTGKGTEKRGPSKHNLLGSQGFEAKMRLVIELLKDAEFPGKRHLCIVKGNYLAEDYKNQSFVLEFNSSLSFDRSDERISFNELKNSNEEGKAEKIQTAKFMAEKGSSQDEIGRTLGVSQTTVSRWLNS